MDLEPWNKEPFQNDTVLEIWNVFSFLILLKEQAIGHIHNPLQDCIIV